MEERLCEDTGRRQTSRLDTQSRREVWKRSFSWPLEGNNPADTVILDFQPPGTEKINFCSIIFLCYGSSNKQKQAPWLLAVSINLFWKTSLLISWCKFNLAYKEGNWEKLLFPWEQISCYTFMKLKFLCQQIPKYLKEVIQCSSYCGQSTVAFLPLRFIPTAPVWAICASLNQSFCVLSQKRH